MSSVGLHESTGKQEGTSVNSYLIALFIHVFSVVGLFAAIGVTVTCLTAAQHVRDALVVRVLTRMAEIADMAIPPVALVALFSGLYMVWRASAWTDGWIVVSLVQFAVAFALGPTVNGRRLARLSRVAKTCHQGAIPARLSRALKDPILTIGERTMTGMTVGVVYLMVMKPSAAGSVIALAIFSIVGFACALPAIANARTPLPVAPEQQVPWREEV